MTNIKLDPKDYETVSGYASALEREGFDQYPMTEEGNYAVKLGLISEIGELCDIENKRIRGDAAYQDPYKLEQMWLKELGDVLWFVVRLAYREGVYLHEPKQEELEKNYTPESLVLELGESSIMWDDIRDLIYSGMIETVFSIARQKGFSPQHVMGTNLEKLIDRKHRNVIKGDGDER